MPPLGTRVKNHLERVEYITDQNKRFVLTGTVGEQWIVDAAKLAKTYTFDNGMPITPDSLKARASKMKTKDGKIHIVVKRFKINTQVGAAQPINWAIFVPKRYIFQIPTAWGDVLTVNAPGVPHGSGDFIVCSDGGGRPNLNDRWVVNGEIFSDTYDMRSFSNVRTTHSIKPIDDTMNPREFRGAAAINNIPRRA